MRTSDKALAASMFFGAFDAVLDHFIFKHQSAWALLFADVPTDKVYFRVAIIISFTVFGFVISGIMAKQQSVEAALQQSEEKHRTILHSIEDGYYEVDLTGNFTFSMRP